MDIFHYKIIYFAYGLLGSYLTTFFLIPIIKKIGLYYSIVDRPDKRKLHNSALVRIGGTSFLVSEIFIFLSFLFFQRLDDSFYLFDNFGFFFLLVTLFFLVGFFDDLFNLSPLKRLFFQTAIASLAWLNGFRIDNFDISFLNKSMNLFEIPLLISFIISVLWIVGITNAFNWLDGLDGLAAGVGAIISFGFFILNLINGQTVLGLFSASLFSICLGFLHYNAYPASILMGDGGSYFLGSNLGLLSILTYSNTTIEKNFLVILTLFALPVFDMLTVICLRLFNKKSPFLPDNNHFHHRLLKLGFSHQKSVVYIYFISIFFLSLSIFLSRN